MRTKPTRQLTLAITALVALAACGASDTDPSAIDRSSLPEAAGSSTQSVPPSTVPAPIDIDPVSADVAATELTANDPAELWTSDRCGIERRTIETAVEAHFAQVGESPGSAQALVDSGMLRDVSPAYEVTQFDTVVEIADGPCRDDGTTDPDPESSDPESSEWGEPLTAPCWIETLAVDVLSNVYEVETGEPLTDVAALASTNWSLFPLDGVLLDLDGSVSIVDVSLCQPVLRSDDRILEELGPIECLESIARISVAVQAHSVIKSLHEVSSSELIDLGYLEAADVLHEYERGVYTPRDPAQCGEFGTAQPDACDVERRTIETAFEAHYAQEGEDVASLQELVDENYLRDLPTNFVLTPGGNEFGLPAIEATPDGRCSD